MRAQVMDIRTGQTQFKVFSAEDTLNNLFVENHDVKFLYRDSDMLHFMHNQTYEQYEVNTSLFGDDVLFLKEDMDLQLVMVDDNKVIDYVLPTTVTCKVAEAEVAVAGNTAGAVLKRIKTDTGLSLQVPNFVNQGDMIKVDTRDGSYVSRV